MADLTSGELREMFSYKPETGEFTRLVRCGNMLPGESAGTNAGNGYLRIHIHGVAYKSHRLAWLYMTGVWPTGVIDHINGDKRDNRFANLRNVSAAVNRQNQRRVRCDSGTGLLGVKRAENGRFAAFIKVDGKLRRIGRFDTPEAAHAAYIKAKRKFHEGCTL